MVFGKEKATTLKRLVNGFIGIVLYGEYLRIVQEKEVKRK